MNHINIKEITFKQILLISIFVVVIIALITIMSAALPQAIDWHGAFRPATLEILHGRSPYNADGFFNPPWVAIFLIPYAILPESIGRAAMALTSLVVYSLVAHRLGAKKITISFLLLSPPVLHGIINGNIDWLVVLGFILPPWIGLFFLSVKPQIGLAVMIFLGVSTWREKGAKKVLATFAPLFGISLISLLLYGPWFLSIQRDLNLIANTSLWPLSIPVGLALLVSAIRKKDDRYAMVASPNLSPYVNLHSWIGAMLAFSSSTLETITIVIGLWIVVVYRLLA